MNIANNLIKNKEAVNVLEDFFKVDRDNITESIEGFNDLFSITFPNSKKIYVALKKITAGGGLNSESRPKKERRIQIKADIVRFIYEKSNDYDAFLLGYTEDEPTILVAFEPSNSTAEFTVSFQIKQDTIQKAKIQGFASQDKQGSWAFAMQDKYFDRYLEGYPNIHKNPNFFL